MDVRVTVTLSTGGGVLSGEVWADITQKNLGHALMGHALQLASIDDPGVDYYTDRYGNIYMGSPDALITCSARLALLIDAANVLIYGKTLVVDEVINPPEQQVSRRDPVLAN